MHIIDADSHVFEPDSLFLRFADKDQRHLIPEVPSYGLLEGTCPLGHRQPEPALVRPTAIACAHPDGGFDPHARLEDMRRESIDQMVCFPSVVTSLCRYEAAVESAMLTAYNSWSGHLCMAAPGRLYAPIVVSMRDIGAAEQEIRRRQGEPWVVGITIPTSSDGRNLDDPFFYPLWEAAEAFDLPILVHAGTARPPYPIGTFEMSDNFFLMHTMNHPFEQMRALACLIGGGVLDRFCRVRLGFFEAGCGWVPWFLERLSEHYEKLPAFVPLLARDPVEHIRDGRCFFSCDPGEISIEHFVATLGEDQLLYASDYPHWDSSFPGSVDKILRRDSLSETTRRKILGENARKLYTRLGK